MTYRDAFDLDPRKKYLVKITKKCAFKNNIGYMDEDAKEEDTGLDIFFSIEVIIGTQLSNPILFSHDQIEILR